VLEAGAILPPLASEMKVDLITNPDGKVMVLHDKPFREVLSWVEYDEELNEITLIMYQGVMQRLGLEIPEVMVSALLKAEEIYLAQVNSGQIMDIYKLKFMISGKVLN
jgi:hypothetical protein